MSTTSTSSSLGETSISGLREQILANAATLYPQEVFDSASWQTFGIVKPEQIFQVVVSGSEQMRATLLCGGPISRIIATGPLTINANSALSGLLSVTCEALEWYTENLLGTMENSEECSNGNVDYSMIVGGFHFAAEQRILAELSGDIKSSE